MRPTLPVLLLLVLPACGVRLTLPTAVQPAPVYEAVAAPADSVWSAAVDLLLDTGTEWDFLHPEMQVARADILVHRGLGWVNQSRLARDEDIEALADCGTRSRQRTEGAWDLWASVAIRVQESAAGGSLLKVVVPRMWQERGVYGGTFRCVSRGLLEAEMRERIRELMRPNIVSANGGR